MPITQEGRQFRWELAPFPFGQSKWLLVVDRMCRVVEKAGYGTTGEACLCRIGPAGEDDRNAGAEDDAGKLCTA
jgi:hypothetical protein